MSTDAALVLGVLTGVGLAGLAYLIATGRLRFTWGPPQAGERIIRTVKTTTHTRLPRDGDDTGDFAETMSPEALQAVEEARKSGRSVEHIVLNINGEERVYDSLDDVPAKYREIIDRHRGTSNSSITIEVNGQRHTYNSRDEVPPEFRRFLPPAP